MGLAPLETGFGFMIIPATGFLFRRVSILARYPRFRVRAKTLPAMADFASKVVCRVGARTYEEDTAISCGRFRLTYYSLSQSKASSSIYHFILLPWAILMTRLFRPNVVLILFKKVALNMNPNLAENRLRFYKF
jgi:hypothetical protein